MPTILMITGAVLLVVSVVLTRHEVLGAARSVWNAAMLVFAVVSLIKGEWGMLASFLAVLAAAEMFFSWVDRRTHRTA